MSLPSSREKINLEIVEKNMGLESGKAHGTPEYVEEDEETKNVRQKMGLVTPSKKEDVEIQYIPRRSITKQWVIDEPRKPKVFALSGFAPRGPYNTMEIVEQEKKRLIESI